MSCLKTFPEMASQVSFQTSAVMWIKKAKLLSGSKHPSLIYPKLQFWKTITFSQLFTSSLLPATVLMLPCGCVNVSCVGVCVVGVVLVAIYAKKQSFLFRFWPCQVTWGILVPQSWVQPRSLAVREPRSPNYWTAREFPATVFKVVLFSGMFLPTGPLAEKHKAVLGSGLVCCLHSATPSWVAPFLSLSQQSCAFPHCQGSSLTTEAASLLNLQMPRVYCTEYSYQGTQTSDKAMCSIITSLIHWNNSRYDEL